VVAGPFRGIRTLFGTFAETLEVYENVKGDTDDYGKLKQDWVLWGTTTAIVTSEENLFEVNESTGEYETDNLNFYFLPDTQPGIDNPRVKRVEADGEFYELGASKNLRSHIETTGKVVRDDVPVEKNPD